ncbi:hypothetical protein BDK62_1177 [Halomonas alkaliantarctica]|jgi:hypothetical protein|nr:hypothetical protein BDK62_1177 [Halomonas alkaliantarctica]
MAGLLLQQAARDIHDLVGLEAPPCCGTKHPER